MADDDSSLMKSIVFVVAFAALFGFLFSYSSNIFTGADPPEQSDFISTNFDIADIGTTTFWTQDNGSEFIEVTESTQYNTLVTWGTWNGFIIADGDDLDFHQAPETVHIFPMTYDAIHADSFLVFQEWGLWDKDGEYITFQTILGNIVETEKNLQASIHLDLQAGITIWFIFPIDSDPETLLYDHSGFTIALGQSLIDATNSANNMWAVITGLLTFNIDTGIPLVNYLISIPIWISIAFIVYSILSRLIPWV